MTTDTTTDRSCRDCGSADNLNDCGEDWGLICDDCGADRYDAMMSNP
jgi:hypothetical protein